jgi:hypothetical protein
VSAGRPDSRRPRRLALAGCAAAGALLALVCLAGAALLAARPPAAGTLFQPLVVRVGNFGLSLAVSGTPDCPPQIVDCAVPPQPDRLYGSLWFWVTTRNPTGITSSFKPLLRLRLR